jgi:uncharacterized sulfatase
MSALARPLLPLLAIASLAGSSAEAAPNIVVILAANQNCDIGCYGKQEVRTPNIDRLAARGVRFTRAYAQHSIGGPSRISLLTALRPDTLGIMYNYRYAPELPKGAFTAGQWLKEQGWFTAKAGRVFPQDAYATSWADAMGGPVEADEMPEGSKSVLAVPVQTHEVNGEKQSLGGTLAIRLADLPDEAFVDARTVVDAVRQLEKAAAARKPFFLAVGFMAPDFRMAAPKSWYDKYLQAEITAPPPATPAAETPKAALWSGILPTREVTQEERRQFIAYYRAMTSFMDAQVGKLLDALDQMKLTQDTLVVFTAVNGFHLGDHGNMWGASSLFDSALRVPLIIAGPGIATGQASPRVVELVDVIPTVLEHCRAKPMRMSDGDSFAQLLKQPAAPSEDPAISFVANYGRHNGAALRTEAATYVRWDGGNSGVELYNYQADPGEMTNLATDKKLAPLARKLEAALLKEKARK